MEELAQVGVEGMYTGVTAAVDDHEENDRPGQELSHSCILAVFFSDLFVIVSLQFLPLLLNLAVLTVLNDRLVDGCQQEAASERY